MLLYALMILTAFLGYTLPWGQMSFWAATVITSLFSAIPGIGQPVVEWLWGGFGVDTGRDRDNLAAITEALGPQRTLMVDPGWYVDLESGPRVRTDEQTRKMLALLTELMEEASAAGELRPGINARRMAAMTMQTVMFVAQSSGDPEDGSLHPITANEAWDFCAHGFAKP